MKKRWAILSILVVCVICIGGIVGNILIKHLNYGKMQSGIAEKATEKMETIAQPRNRETNQSQSVSSIYLYHGNQVKMLAEDSDDYEKIRNELNDILMQCKDTMEMTDGAIGFVGYGEALSKGTKEYFIEVNFKEPVTLTYDKENCLNIQSVVISLDDNCMYPFLQIRKKGEKSSISYTGFMAEEGAFSGFNFVKTYFEE